MFKRDLESYSPWRVYQRGERWCWGLILGFVPGVLLIGIPLAWLFGSEAPIYIVAIVWMIALLAAGYAHMAFPCPRCEKPFFQTMWFHNAFARKCVHCGLPKWD